MLKFTTDDGLQMLDALRAATHMIGHDDHTPILAGVNLKLEQGVLTITATDRYKLMRASVPNVNGDDGEVTVVGKRLATALRALPKRGKRTPPAWPLHVEEDVNRSVTYFSHGWEGTVCPVPTIFDEYPNLKRIGGDGPAAPYTSIGIRPADFAALDKMPREGQGHLEIRFGEGHKPMRTDWQAWGLEYTVVMMPVPVRMTS